MEAKKIGLFLEKVFGWGILLCLLAGGVAFFGFLLALIIGGGADSAAHQMSVFIQKQYFPVVITCASITVGIGLLSMYLAKTQALSLKTEKKEAEDELKQIKAEEKATGE